MPFRWIPLCNNGPSESQAEVTKGTRWAEESSESVSVRNWGDKKKHYKNTPDISFLLLKVIISLMSVLEGKRLCIQCASSYVYFTRSIISNHNVLETVTWL